MNNILKDIRKTISNPSEQQKKFFKDACDTLNNHDSTDKIACFPAMPGIGKSTFIKAYIKQCAENCVGLVVLTDRWDLIETFRGCQLEYLSAIAILEKDTLVKDMISEIERKPVIIMTTQRFFALDEKYRKMLFVYQYRWFGQYRRNIIIDECPIFHQTMNINLEAFQIARSNVYASLDESVGDRYEINHMLMESEKCFAKFIETIDKKYEKDTYFFVQPDELIDIKNSLVGFFDRIDNDRTILQGCTIETVAFLNAFKSVLNDGAIFVCTKKNNGNAYKNEFIFYNNRQECIDIRHKYCKVVIFDGTCDINPSYRKEEIFNIKNRFDYMRKIDLTLNFVDVPTSKKALNNDHNYKIIKKYIEEKNISDGLYITYKNYIKMFEKYKYANYFGNIKGLNEYKDLTQMFQVGLNMFPPLEYFFVLCDNYDWLYRSVSQMSLEKSIEFFHKIIQLREDYYVNDLNLKDEIECVKAYSILSDFEQNLFRISIRNSNNTTPNICWLFFHHSHEEYTLILNTLINRYNEYGATVNLLETPLIMTLNKILQRDNGGTKTKVQEVLRWIMEKEPNKEFTTKEIKNDLGMDNRAFDKVKEKGLNELFKLIKVEGRNAYIINDNVAKMLNMLK